MRWHPLGVVTLAVLSVMASGQQIVPGITSTAASTNERTDFWARENPQSTVVNFLEACRSLDYEKASRYLDLRGLPVTERGAKGPVLAKELEELLDRNVAFDPGSLSRNPGFSTGSSVREIVATLGDDGPADEVYVERIELRPQRLVWQFSADSVALISRLYQRSGQSEFEKRLPGPLVNWVFLDTSLWRWLVLLLLTVVLSALASILARGLLRLVRLLFSRVAFHLHAEFIEALVGPLRLIVIVVGFRAALEFIGPSALLRFYLGRGLSLLLAVGAAWLGMDLIDVATDRFRLRTAATPGDLRSSALPLMNKTVKIAIFVFAVTAILSSWGYDTTTVVAGVGVGGLAVALAAQKTIENLFGGMAVLSDRQVLVGDYCKFGDRTGTVEEIGLRSTRVRTLERTLVTVPNAQFSAMTLENFSRRDRTWFHPRLSLTRETSSAQIRHVLDAVSSVLASNNKVEPETFSVRFAAVRSYSLDVDVSAYILTSNDDEFGRIQQELLLCALEAVEAAGSSLALPTQASINYNADTDARLRDG